MKILTGSERPAGPPKFEFTEGMTLFIASCAPVKDEPESSFWRRIEEKAA